jgi:hypothetical protein
MLTSLPQFVVKALLVGATLAVAGGFAFGDTVYENGGPSAFTNMPANLASLTPDSGTPYWNNDSGDGSQKNIGYFLTGTGGFSGGTDYNPQGYLSQPGTPDMPANFDLARTTNSLQITLLGTDTTDRTDVFGYYDASQTTTAGAEATEHPLFDTTSSVTGSTTVNLASSLAASGITNYGFYMVKCADHPACTQTYTFFSNSALDIASGDSAGHQHFALFNSAADPNVFYLGSEDWFWSGPVENLGDYNDMVFLINSDGIPTPEPATFVLVGAGLLGLGIAHFRRSSKAGRSIT